MSIFFLIISIVAIIVGFVYSWVGGVITMGNSELTETEANRRYATVKKVGRNIKLGGIALLLVAAIFSAVVVTPTSTTNVVTIVGQVQDIGLTPGISFKMPFISDVYTVSNKLREVKLEGQVWGESSEQIPVYAQGTTIVYIVTQSGSVPIVRDVQTKDQDLLTQTLVSSAIKDGMTTQPSESVTKRSMIEPAVVRCLQESVDEKYGEGYIIIRDVNIDDMDFEPEYNQAIAQRSTAAMKQQSQAIVNQTAIDKAEADKQVTKLTAEATAEKNRIEAEAEANRIKALAEAEAEANRVLAESLNDSVLKNKFYDKWDGTMPAVLGEGQAIVDIR